MRYIKDIRNTQYKIGLYQWNGKYIIKIEAGGAFEQVYKIDETDLASPDEIDLLLDQVFMTTVSQRFDQMHESLGSSLLRNGLVF